MNWMILAVGLELSGFILASISVFLRIGLLKRIADKFKENIIKTDRKISNFRLNNSSSDKYKSSIFFSNIKYVFLITFIGYPRLLLSQLGLLWRFNKSFRKLKTLKKENPEAEFVFDSDLVSEIKESILRSYDFRESPENSRSVYFKIIDLLEEGEEESVTSAYEYLRIITKGDIINVILFVPTLWVMTIVLAPLLRIIILIMDIIATVITKLTEADVITNACIFIGTFGVIVGLIIEFSIALKE